MLIPFNVLGILLFFCLLVSSSSVSYEKNNNHHRDVISREEYLSITRTFLTTFPNRSLILDDIHNIINDIEARTREISEKNTKTTTTTTTTTTSDSETNSKTTDDVYWWYFPQTDCGYDDVTSANCQNKSIDECKSLCLATTGCGGFNYPHGILKKTDCLVHKAYESTVDLYILASTPQPPPAALWPPVWPYPAAFTNGSIMVIVDSVNFRFTAKTPSPDITAAFQRYQKLFFPHPASSSSIKERQLKTGLATLSEVTVSAIDVSGVLQLETDESYTLVVPSDGTAASLSAKTVFGVFRGLETLSQLILFNFDSKVYQIAGTPWRFDDKPRFAHREVLLDTSRHFLPLQTLYNMIDSLPYSKINVIHWHIVDSQSFPFDSVSRPLLSSKGAYSMQERYSVEDVASIVEYSRQRGVRIMLEIDNPGHAASWCAGYPDVCPSPTCLEPLNPAVNATWDLITALWGDVTGGKRGSGLIPDNMFHLGGDEVNTACWTESPSISQWLTSMNLTADGGYEYFVNRSQSIARSMGRDVVGWEEIWDHFGTSLDPSTIIHQWLPGSNIAVDATAAGYRVLWSTDGVWYLDGLDVTWEVMYTQEPCTGIPDDLCAKLMLGGGGEMWGETVDTSDLQNTIWPRLAAIGERLWSPRNITDILAAEPRYAAFRCLLNRRGVAAAPYNNAYARSAPPHPGGCYQQ